MACRTRPAGLSQTGTLKDYFAAGAAAGAVVVAVEVIVDCSAGFGFGASCFWQPVKARTAATAETAMIAVIFFMLFHPLSIMKFTAVRLSQ